MTPKLLCGLLIAATCSLGSSSCRQPKDQATQAQKRSIQGTVEGIQNGKDGYTAMIRARDGRLYQATVSRINLSEASAYRTLSPGDQVTVTGDFWHSGQENFITVRQLH